MNVNIKVFIAYLTNNRKGKRIDVNGRDYRYVYKRFGHKCMVNEFKSQNSWRV
jgi:hypothetical protein